MLHANISASRLNTKQTKNNFGTTSKHPTVHAAARSQLIPHFSSVPTSQHLALLLLSCFLYRPPPLLSPPRLSQHAQCILPTATLNTNPVAMTRKKKKTQIYKKKGLSLRLHVSKATKKNITK